MLLAASVTKSFSRPRSSISRGSPFYSDAGAATYNKADAAGAKKLLAEPSTTTPIVPQFQAYEFTSPGAVMAENLKRPASTQRWTWSTGRR